MERDDRGSLLHAGGGAAFPGNIMKSTAWLFIFACMVPSVAPSAHASGLRLTPEHPAANQPFVIDFDYVTPCIGPMNPVSAVLEPPNPVRDFTHVGVQSTIQCFDSTASRAVHMSATMTGLASGTYPIYSLVGVLDGLDPPFQDALLQGNVAVAAEFANPVPAFSAWGCALLVLAIGLLVVATRIQRERRP